MKRITCIAAVLAVLSLAACGGGGGESTGLTQAEKEAAEQAAREEAERQERERLEREARERAEREAAERAAARLAFPLEAWSGTWYDAEQNITWYPAAFGTQHYGISRVAPFAASDAQHMPTYHDKGVGGGLGLEAPERRFFVGVDQGEKTTDYFTVGGQVHSIVRSSGLADLPVVSERDAIAVRHGSLSDGAGRAAVVEYLRDASAGSASIPLWQSPPEVRLVGTSTAAERQRLISAVQLLNAALPEGAKLTMGTSSQARDEGIDVEFVDCYGPRHSCGGGTAAATEFTRKSDGRIEHSYIVFSRETVSYGRERETVILLAHELMHSLGLYHASSATFATILEGTGAIHHTEQAGQPQPLSLLYSIDREALRALYGELEIGDGPEDLGPWSANSMHLAGNGPHANFGVALRNGYVEPWAHGYLPDTDLASNSALFGSATWTGTLLGFSGQAPVAGDAEIGVNLATMGGTADFTRLESWAAGAAPGEAGTGATWLDGDLGYTIAVRGNTFRETGGDDGRLTGIFTGQSHEGAAGTLERQDLTAAFGASR